jgi:uncharacterized protein GlcG (DUF336 family)
MIRHLAPQLLALTGLLACASIASAQAPPDYGMPIATEAAKRVAAAALAKARESNWQMAISIVDPAGVLVYFERIDGTQNGSSNVATEKARSAALFKRPTKAFQDALAAGGEGLRIQHIPGAVAIDGGLPIVMGGRIVGAIGVSGGTSAQDGVVALAGVGAVR